MKTLLLELQQDDLRVGSHAHGRAPGSGAAGSVDLQGAEAMQSIGELAEDAAREPGEGEELPAVGVAGELQAESGLAPRWAGGVGM